MTEGQIKKRNRNKRKRGASVQNEDVENKVEKVNGEGEHNDIEAKKMKKETETVEFKTDKSEGEETTESTTDSNVVKIQKKKRNRKKKKQQTDDGGNDDDDDEKEEKRLLSEMNKAKIERVKKLKSQVLESVAAAQDAKRAEDIEGAEKAVGKKETKNIRHKTKEQMTTEELKEMKKRKLQKRKEKKQALKKQKEKQQNGQSGVSIEVNIYRKNGQDCPQCIKLPRTGQVKIYRTILLNKNLDFSMCKLNLKVAFRNAHFFPDTG